MGVNSNTFRRFMDPKTYKDQWSAMQNGTYWAGARLLASAEREGKEEIAKGRSGGGGGTAKKGKTMAAAAGGGGKRKSDSVGGAVDVDDDDDDDTKTMTKKAKKGRTGNEMKREAEDLISRINAVEYVNGDVVYDTCPEVVAGIKTFLQRDGMNKAMLLSALGGINQNSMARFMSGKKQDQCGNVTYGRAYAFLEKLRILEGAPKSKARLRNEVANPEGVRHIIHVYIYIPRCECSCPVVALFPLGLSTYIMYAPDPTKRDSSPSLSSLKKHINSTVFPCEGESREVGLDVGKTLNGRGQIRGIYDVSARSYSVVNKNAGGGAEYFARRTSRRSPKRSPVAPTLLGSPRHLAACTSRGASTRVSRARCRRKGRKAPCPCSAGAEAGGERGEARRAPSSSPSPAVVRGGRAVAFVFAYSYSYSHSSPITHTPRTRRPSPVVLAIRRSAYPRTREVTRDASPLVCSADNTTSSRPPRGIIARISQAAASRRRPLPPTSSSSTSFRPTSPPTIGASRRATCKPDTPRDESECNSLICGQQAGSILFSCAYQYYLAGKFDPWSIPKNTKT